MLLLSMTLLEEVLARTFMSGVVALPLFVEGKASAARKMLLLLLLMLLVTVHNFSFAITLMVVDAKGLLLLMSQPTIT